MIKASSAVVAVFIFVSGPLARYQPLEYPRAAVAVSDIALSVEGELKAGATVEPSFRITSTQRLAPPRLFPHVLKDDKTLHVAVFESGRPLESGVNVLGPSRWNFPSNCPAELTGWWPECTVNHRPPNAP